MEAEAHARRFIKHGGARLEYVLPMITHEMIRNFELLTDFAGNSWIYIFSAWMQKQSHATF